MGHAQEHTIHGKGRPAEGLGRAQTNVNKGFVADSTPINASHQTRLEWTEFETVYTGFCKGKPR